MSTIDHAKAAETVNAALDRIEKALNASVERLTVAAHHGTSGTDEQEGEELLDDAYSHTLAFYGVLLQQVALKERAGVLRAVEASKTRKLLKEQCQIELSKVLVLASRSLPSAYAKPRT